MASARRLSDHLILEKEFILCDTLYAERHRRISVAVGRAWQTPLAAGRRRTTVKFPTQKPMRAAQFTSAFVKREDAHNAKPDDGGASFSKPLRIKSIPSTVHGANMFRGPDLTLGHNPLCRAARSSLAMRRPSLGAGPLAERPLPARS